MPLPALVQQLERDLRDVFGRRMLSLVAYGLQSRGHGAKAPVRTLALIESLSELDLRACAGKITAWHAAGLATPLLLAAEEFERSLDAFPLEFGAIIVDHIVVSGTPPFAQAHVDAADVRRACEVQARSHLLHLRQGFVEAHGNGHALAVLVVASAAPLMALVASVARLEGRHDASAESAARHAEHAAGVTGGLAEIVALSQVHEIPAAEAERLFPAYLTAMERLVRYVDGWSAQ